jgi:hypothetical protein
MSIYLRAYTISANLPYFYDEDEAHHFNRTVNMAKSGDLNPHYFNKPSLHFYLRIPVVWASVLWSKHKGYLNSIDDVRTFNKFGVADYAFTASHPGIVKWNRALSLFFSLLIIFFTYLIGGKICGTNFGGLLAAAGAAVSPPLIAYSGFIGVDTLMSLMCLLSVFFSLKALEDKTSRCLILASVFGGLAVSSKYNALPIVATPLLAAYMGNHLTRKNILICCILPILSFFAASPYILVSIPLFITNLSYEVWHYSTAGHEGHSANPGLDQLVFYLNWFWNEALGICFSFAALMGVILMLIRKNRLFITFLSFPLLYFLMMVMQRANFTRNMLVILPFLFIAAAFAIYKFLEYLKFNRNKICFFSAAFFILSSGQPLSVALIDKNRILNRTESRAVFTKWAFEEDKSTLQTAISGDIQAASQIPLNLKNYTTFDPATENIYSLWLKGYDRVILGPENYANFPLEYLKLIKAFPGLKEKQRIMENPRIEVYEILSDKFPQDKLIAELEKCPECHVSCEKAAGGFSCKPKKGQEKYIWMNKRLTVLELPGLNEMIKQKGEKQITFEVMSPWDNKIGIYPMRENNPMVLNTPGSWNKVSLSIHQNDLISADTILVFTGNILAPYKQGKSPDKRMLGMALKSVLPD